MSIFNLISLLGGLAMFLYGMRMMGNALKEGSSGTLKVVLEHVTDNPVKAFLLGMLMTAIIQSSTATIVITSGLVGAGILSLHQSLGIIIGANVGTTITGQILRLLDLNGTETSWIRIFQPSTLAPVMLIIGIILIMGFNFKKSQFVGNVLIGFGILFSGLMNMTGAVQVLTDSGIAESLFSRLGDNPVLGYMIGAFVAFVLQSSSASVGILQAFSASGLLQFREIYAVIVGIYLGDCLTTAIVCSIGSKTEAKRVGMVNILYNLSKSALVLIVVAILFRIGLLNGLWNMTVDSGVIANTNTVFNLACALALLPLIGIYEKFSCRIIRDQHVKPEKYKEKLNALNPVFFNTPALALRSCYDLLLTMFLAARSSIDQAMMLLVDYSQTIYDELEEEENRIDSMTDRVSRYIVDLLPHLTNTYHISILDQYYKVTAEFEHLGDQAMRIAGIAKRMHEEHTAFSDKAMAELGILEDIIDQMLTYAEQAFEKRNVDSAFRIEPLKQTASDVVSQLQVNHLKRMSAGVCDIYADSAFTNLLADLKRIANIGSNIGAATVIRVNPEIADHEHFYFSGLHAGHNENYNTEYNRIHRKYFQQLRAIEPLMDRTEKNAAAQEAAVQEAIVQETAAQETAEQEAAVQEAAVQEAQNTETE